LSEKIIKSKTVVLLFTIIWSNTLNAQLFTQDFESSTSVSDYISVVPNIGEFNGMTTGQSGLITSINKLQFERTDAATMYAYRNYDFTENPTFVQLKFDFELSNYQSGTQNPTLSVFIGNSFFNASFGTDVSVKGTENDPIYQTQPIGIEAYKFDVPDGTYELSLLMAELKSKGENEMTISVNGKQIWNAINLKQTY